MGVAVLPPTAGPTDFCLTLALVFFVFLFWAMVGVVMMQRATVSRAVQSLNDLEASVGILVP
jgi:hypothetical protein